MRRMKICKSDLYKTMACFSYRIFIFKTRIFNVRRQHGAGTGNAYAFAYDNLGRLTSSTRHAGGVQLLSYTERDLAYDRNGNITALKRYGSNGGVPQDNFSYSYNGNSLASITESISAAYSHDQNGNMTFDGRKNLQISYNLLNLPQTVNQASMQMATTTTPQTTWQA